MSTTSQTALGAPGLTWEEFCALPDPTDGRARLVRLTDRGRAVNETVRRHLDGVEREWARRVGEERYAVARSVLADLVPGAAAARTPVTVEE